MKTCSVIIGIILTTTATGVLSAPKEKEDCEVHRRDYPAFYYQCLSEQKAAETPHLTGKPPVKKSAQKLKTNDETKVVAVND